MYGISKAYPESGMYFENCIMLKKPKVTSEREAAGSAADRKRVTISRERPAHLGLFRTTLKKTERSSY